MRRGQRTWMFGAVALACLSGCLERTVTIKSDPPGAVAWVNDVEVGRTPATATFEFYGTFEVRLAAEGREPMTVGKQAWAPVYEYPPMDLLASAWPGRVRTELVWEFTLPPAERGREGLMERARSLREELTPKP
ncbi:MAG: PEGA domain-containing protein [Phycisphaerae bacterium]|nr:PEGA domain-containing protein [Phycisphaerae bacterium]